MFEPAEPHYLGLIVFIVAWVIVGALWWRWSRGVEDR